MESEGNIPTGKPSAAVQGAQALLRQLREKHGIQPATRSELPCGQNAARPVEKNWSLINAQTELRRRRREEGIANLTSHRTTISETSPVAHKSSAAPKKYSSLDSRTILVHPTILLAMLRQHQEAPSRAWLLLRVIDADGRGWLDVEHIRHCLTAKDSPLRIYGWRRLRQLLKQGEGVFWQRDRDRLWLNGAHKVAYKLDLERLQGFPVELPVQALLGGIQAVRAAFYAAFHGGRDSKPISRDALHELSGVPSRTQLEYERVAHVERSRNVAIGERYTTENLQERAWHHGRGVFHFVDKKGRQGRAGREYVAWQMPNSYRADYQRRSRGSRKRLNRELADLVNKGIPGNDEQAIERIFFPSGALAARRYNRIPEQDAYWQRGETARPGNGLWCVISGMRNRQSRR
jgi:hypothetical protein